MAVKQTGSGHRTTRCDHHGAPATAGVRSISVSGNGLTLVADERSESSGERVAVQASGIDRRPISRDRRMPVVDPAFRWETLLIEGRANSHSSGLAGQKRRAK